MSTMICIMILAHLPLTLAAAVYYLAQDLRG